MITLNPYLVFKDSCEEAFNFYERIFYGNLLHISRYKDLSSEVRKFFPRSADEKVIHATLKLTSQINLMGCDSIEAYESSTQFVNNFYLYISTDSQQEAIRIFNELVEEGEITMPIGETYWSKCYGMLTDKFGIRWKITSSQTD